MLIHADLGKLLLRLTLGILLLLHGIDKLQHGVGGISGMLSGAGLPGFLAYGVYLGEVLAPLLIIFGYYARIGALLVIGNMLVAITLAHSTQLFQLTDHGGWALELQGFYLLTAVVVFLIGAGRYRIRDI